MKRKKEEEGFISLLSLSLSSRKEKENENEWNEVLPIRYILWNYCIVVVHFEC